MAVAATQYTPPAEALSPASAVDPLTGLKVCFIAGTLGQGGAERQLFYTVRALVENGATPQVLSLTHGEFWEDPIRRLNVPVVCVGHRQSRVTRLLKIGDAVRRFKPAIVQSQHFYTNLYAVAAARLSGARDVGAIRSNASWEISALGRFGRPSLLAPRFIAANSRPAIANALALGATAGRVRFVPNVVDTAAFVPVTRERGGAIRVLGIGRRTPEKRFDRFLEVLAAVRHRTSRSVHGVLVTTGVNDRALEARAAALGLPPDVMEFREPAADVAALYRRADILLLTSDREGTPNVVLEAMAAGVPVVATRVGGIPDLIRHGHTGFLADVSDLSALSDAVVSLVEDDEARSSVGRRAREHVVREHALHRLPDVLREFYRMVIT